jgi:ABC-type transport system involved in multi-copper enzyme maturation permease subunit
MMRSLHAELIRLARWPVTWILCGIWIVLNLVFGYVFNYLTYHSEGGVGFSADASTPDNARAVLAQMMPDSVPITVVKELPLAGGALLLILGALAFGSGYAWGTWKTVFLAGPRRSVVVTGTLAALAVIVTGLVLATFAIDLLAAYTIAAAESQPVLWPAFADLARGVGAALLIGGMWTTAGALLGTLTRGPALAVGIGLVWTLVVENLLRGFAPLLGPVEAVTNLLPGTAAGSLAHALGAVPVSDPNGTPGVTTAISGTTAVALLAVYLFTFVAVSLALKARRDITT